MNLNDEWREALEDALVSYSFSRLQKFLRHERNAGKSLCPSEEAIFAALNACPPSKVKAVIMGNEPYVEAGMADGLAFSVKDGKGFPPPFLNILEELNEDLGYLEPVSGSLLKWAEQGVLLLNTCLTVEQNKAGSHRDLGWEDFTDSVISYLNRSRQPIVFMLWGSEAHGKSSLITNPKHLVLKTTHPDPFSANKTTRKAIAFLGSKPFSQTNKHLAKFQLRPIDWALATSDNYN